MGRVSLKWVLLWAALILGTDAIADSRPANHGAPGPRSSSTPPTYTIKLPSYDSERVQKVTRELLETLREQRPDNWEALERATGAIPWNSAQGRQLPAFDSNKVGAAMENIASDITRERPGSWDELKGILKNYTGTIPPAVMEDIIAYRILQRKASDSNEDALAKGLPPPATDAAGPSGTSGSSGSVRPDLASRAAMDSIAANKIGLFSQFFQSGAGTPIGPALPSSAAPASGAAGTSPLEKRPPFLAPEKSAAKPNFSDTAPVASAAGTGILEKLAQAIGPAPLTAAPTSPAAAPLAKAFPVAGTPPPKMQAAIAADSSILPANIAGPMQANPPKVAYTVDEPALEPEDNEETLSPSESAAGSDTSSGNYVSSSSVDENEDTGAMDGLLAFIQAWLLSALDAEPREITRAIASTTQLQSDTSLAGVGPDMTGLFQGFGSWAASRAGRHQAVTDLGERMGLEARAAMAVYHCALATAWLATLGFAAWIAFYFRRLRRRQLRA